MKQAGIIKNYKVESGYFLSNQTDFSIKNMIFIDEIEFQLLKEEDKEEKLSEAKLEKAFKEWKKYNLFE